MAAISGSSAASTSATADGGDDTTKRLTKPGTKRLFLTLSVLFSFLVGLPFLLSTTAIYRSPLPFASIESLSTALRSQPPFLPCRFHLVSLLRRPASASSALPDRLASLISEEIKSLSGERPSCGGCGGNYTISVTVDSVAGGGCARSRDGRDQYLWQCGKLGFSDLAGIGDDESVDELLESALWGGEGCSGGGGKVYTVVVVEEEDGGGGVRVVVGKHRHAWMVGRVSDEDVVAMAGKIFVKVFMNGGGKEEGGVGQGKAEFMPVGSDGSVVLSFSLLNANPSDWVYDWDFQKLDDGVFGPVVKALAPIADISVESQILYHTPKSSFSSWDESLGAYTFSTKDLPFFVNSNEWHLDTSIRAAGRTKVLQFVVYVPSAKECPLLLHLPNEGISMTNGFISPMWGGIAVWNPPTCLKDSWSTHAKKKTIASEDLHKILQVFMGQLRLLFGLQSDILHDAELGISSFLPSERGFSDWELDFLFRRHACFNLLSCADTLESLSTLVQSLPRMIVMDEIGKQVKFSLEAASFARGNASIGIYDASAASSRQARALAEDAFFHPSIMSISYSSAEHYFAIYMPFFAPVALHILLAATKELKRYKKERVKYLASIAFHAKSE